VRGDARDAQRKAFDQRARQIRALPPRSAYDAAGELIDDHSEMRGLAADLRAESALRIWEAGDVRTIEALGVLLGMSKQRASQLLQRGREIAAIKSTQPEPQPVVAAIVTSRKGVLVTERKDGRPRFGFVTGEIEPLESPADAAVREVKEETGLEVRHGRIIGRRVHPDTARTMIYMTAQVTGRSGEPFVGDDAELERVFWVSVAEAQKLMPTMFEPVRKYLERTLRRGSGT
jgi:8-oxo-dGTP diphosphatase